jgi:hypothetical protein
MNRYRRPAAQNLTQRCRNPELIKITYALFQFVGKLVLPILGGVKNVEDVNLFVIEIVDRDMTMPFDSATDDNVAQIRPRLDGFSALVGDAQFANCVLQKSKIIIGMDNPLLLCVPAPNLVQFV